MRSKKLVIDRVAPREMIKAYSESRIELQNLQISKKMLGKSRQFLPSEQLCEPKSLEVALKIAGAEKIHSETCGWGQPRGHLIQVLNERSLNHCGDFCLLWLVIHKSV